MNLEIKKSVKPVKYEDAIKLLEERLLDINNNKKGNLLWILEHEEVYTAGTNSKEEEILNKSINIIKTNRGGKITYHGPGQIIAYPIINLKRLGIKPTDYVNTLITGIEIFLSSYEIKSDNRTLTGVWVTGEKIASLGIKVSKGVTTHGLAVNINTDLSYFENIIACGIDNSVPTSLSKILNRNITIEDTYKNLATSIGKSLDMEVSWQNRD